MELGVLGKVETMSQNVLAYLNLNLFSFSNLLEDVPGK